MTYKTAGKPKSGQAITARGEKNGSSGGNGKNLNDEPKTSLKPKIQESITAECRRACANPEAGIPAHCKCP
jgi:hypothetical protein